MVKKDKETHAGKTEQNDTKEEQNALDSFSRMSDEDITQILYDLEVHQVELSMQNEELRRIQSEFQASRDRFLELYDFAPVAYFTLDRESRIKELNHAASGLLGGVKSRLVNKKFTIYVAPDFAGAFHIFQKQIMEAQTRQIIEVKMTKSDGTDFYAILSGIPAVNASGNPEGFLITATDITDRKRWEEEREHLLQQVQSEHTRLEAVLAQMPAGVIISDAFENIIFLNKQVENIWRIKSKLKFIKEYSYLPRFYKDRKRYRPEDAPLRRSMEKGELVMDEEVGFIRGDDTRGTMIVSSAPIRDREGRITGGVVTFMDITERRLLEKSLEKYRDHLEELIKQRTAELASANEVLKAEIERRREDDIQIRDLTRRLMEAHEIERREIGRELHDVLGQSLTVLKLSLHRAKISPPEKSASLISDMEKQVSEMVDVTRNLSQNLRPTMLDDMGLLHALLWLTERFGSQAGISIHFEHSGLEERLPREIETAAYRIIQEALTNVSRHSGAREANVKIWRDFVSLHLEISDKGRGFDPNMKSKSNGIAIMRERALLLGGKLDIISAPGAGTQIKAHFPLSAK